MENEQQPDDHAARPPERHDPDNGWDQVREQAARIGRQLHAFESSYGQLIRSQHPRCLERMQQCIAALDDLARFDRSGPSPPSTSE